MHKVCLHTLTNSHWHGYICTEWWVEEKIVWFPPYVSKSKSKRFDSRMPYCPTPTRRTPPPPTLMPPCQSRIRHGPTSTKTFPFLQGWRYQRAWAGHHAGNMPALLLANPQSRANTHYTFGFVSCVTPPLFPCASQFVFLDPVSLWGPVPNWPGGSTEQLEHRSRAVSLAAILGAVW